MKDSIIDKVKKLLAKAGSTDSTQEAESLFTAAQKLMVKHRIQQNELDAEATPEIRDFEVLCFKNRLEGNWELKLAKVLSRANCCDTVYSKFNSKQFKNTEVFNKITFYGVEQDVQLVKFFFETSRETFRRLAKSEYRRLSKEGAVDQKNRFIRSFLIGACDGLQSKITKMTADHVQETGATTYDLIVRNGLDKVRDFLKSNVDFKTVKPKYEPGSLLGHMSGVVAGKNHSLHIPVETPSSGSNKVNHLN